MVVQEVERSHRNRIDADEIAATIREAVADAHELSIQQVVLVMPGGVPKTTSGKYSAALPASWWQAGRLDVIGAVPPPSSQPPAHIASGNA